MSRSQLTWIEAIDKVLREAGEPLTYLEIAERIVQQRLRTDPGPTPSYTVAAQFSSDKKKGEASRFIRVSTGTYGLRDWMNAEGSSRNESSEDHSDVKSARVAVYAYGIFWERSAIDWRKTAPRLLGQQFENADPIDFCEQRGIYVLFDHRDIVYAGRATQQSLGSRLRDHTLDRLRTRWDRFSWFGFSDVAADGVLKSNLGAKCEAEDVISILEAVLIELAEPPQNRQQGKGLAGVEYLQKLDPSLRDQQKRELMGAFAKMLESTD